MQTPDTVRLTTKRTGYNARNERPFIQPLDEIIMCGSQRSIRHTQVAGSPGGRNYILFQETRRHKRKKLCCKYNYRFPRSDGTQKCLLTILEDSFSPLLASKHARCAHETLQLKKKKTENINARVFHQTPVGSQGLGYCFRYLGLAEGTLKQMILLVLLTRRLPFRRPRGCP